MGKTRILVVEDENVVREYIKGTLEDLGYDVPAAVATGEDAIESAEKTRPDLVLMDIRLKGEIDGIGAAEQIGSRFNIPVIYLTSYADSDTLQRAKITKPFGYIVKPFDEKELHATIEIALYRHQEDKHIKERLFQELQSTTRRISGLARELADVESPVLSPPTREPHTASQVSFSPLSETPSVEEKTFTVKEAAKYLAVSDRTIQRMIKEGIFPDPSVTIELGGNRKLRRWKQEDLDTFKPHLRGRGRPKGH